MSRRELTSTINDYSDYLSASVLLWQPRRRHKKVRGFLRRQRQVERLRSEIMERFLNPRIWNRHEL